MRCPYCRADNDRVIDSRSAQESHAIRRRRECLSCRRRFTTYERVEETPLRVVKKDGSREGFNGKKILVGMVKSCEKRPVPAETLEKAAEHIELLLNRMFDREVTTRFIGQQVMQELKKIDQVAYVRFASVYREFKDVSQFLEELRPIMEQRKGSNGARGNGTVGLH